MPPRAESLCLDCSFVSHTGSAISYVLADDQAAGAVRFRTWLDLARYLDAPDAIARPTAAPLLRR
jgi:hypothetical protein